jgi:hypothetical protein
VNCTLFSAVSIISLWIFLLAMEIGVIPKSKKNISMHLINVIRDLKHVVLVPYFLPCLIHVSLEFHRDSIESKSFKMPLFHYYKNNFRRQAL